MKTKHLSDTDIQLFISDKQDCELAIVEHIKICEHCKAKANEYELLFANIKQQTVPVFDFDLSSLVLSQIIQPKPKFELSNYINQALLFTSMLIVIVLLFLISKYLLPNITDIHSQSTYLIITTAIMILLFNGIDIFRKHKGKITALNYY